MSCPACGGCLTAFWFRKATEHGTYSIHRCSRCGSGFVCPRPTPVFLENFYAGYDHSRNRNGNSAHSVQERLRQIVEEEKCFPNSTLDAERIAAECRRLTTGD